jgi:hypothetical protein
MPMNWREAIEALYHLFFPVDSEKVPFRKKVVTLCWLGVFLTVIYALLYISDH